MGLRVFWRFASDSGTMTANSTATGFPATNLQRNTLQPSKSWASDGSQATDTVTVDLGSVQTVSAFAWLAHDIDSADVLTLRYASDSGFSADVGTETPTWYEDSLIHYFTGVNRRYWRFEIDKDTPANTTTAARFLLGDHTNLTRTIAIRYGEGASDNTSKIIVTEGAQTYADIGVNRDGLTGNLIVDETEKVEIEDLRKTFQNAVPFVASVDWTNAPIEKSHYGRFNSIGMPVHTGAVHWTYRWNQIEQK